MASAVSTKDKLSTIFDDIDLITKQLLEIALHGVTKTSGQELVNLTALIIEKDNELNGTLKLAEEQAKIEETMCKLREEIERQDQHIRQLEKHMKEAEQLVAIANYQAKQKLQSINEANKRPVPADELIKYAHMISSSESVCAPLTWQPGDHRRPYPTEIDMRMGLLMRYNDSPINGHMIPHQSNLSDFRSGHNAEPPVSIPNQFAWHPTGDIHMTVPNQGSVPIETRSHKDTEDVEVMSTDSSSSSSSDSQ